MKIVIACDSFKGSMSAKRACHAIEKGIKKIDNSAECLCIPMADGGEGTTDVVMETMQAFPCSVKVQDPFGNELIASYAMNKEGIAIIEVAATCGIDLIPQEKRNPVRGSSYGLGQMIKDALQKKVKKVIIGLGGSGTNDGGYGMLHALGTKFYDKEGTLLPATLTSIEKIDNMDLAGAYQILGNCELIGASDVDNVFTGHEGATAIFGKQKGANKQQLAYLEKALTHFQNVIFRQYNIELNTIKKSGSAGGIGGALVLLRAHIISGIDFVMKSTKFEQRIQGADYIMTGEGSIDSQTRHGKTISGIAKIASQYNIPVIAFGGRISDDAECLYDLGITTMFSILNEVKPLHHALLDGEKYLQITAEKVYRLILAK